MIPEPVDCREICIRADDVLLQDYVFFFVMEVIRCDKKRLIGLLKAENPANATQFILGVSTRTCVPGNRRVRSNGDNVVMSIVSLE